MNIPTGVAVGYGGVWVLNSPDLLYMGEKDGKEISRQTVLTGFGRTDTHELPNSLTWDPDGWLYGLNGVFNTSEVLDKHGQRHRFTCATWRCIRQRRISGVCGRDKQPLGIACVAEAAIRRGLPLGQRSLVSFCGNRHLQPPGRGLSAVCHEDRLNHRSRAPENRVLWNRQSRHRRVPRKYRERMVVGNIHGGFERRSTD